MNEYQSKTERAVSLQAKALTIKDYMQEAGTMEQIEAALPTWLRPDRFIRLFYTAMMKNPALLECSKQSLLSSMIEAAQIGLEPVLGKAALIPYKGEVQFQPMYKGLMEVARRFADINITAHVVYEKDEFDIEWGDNESLYHKPALCAEESRGKKIGAYDIWRIGGTVRSRRFMTLDEILYIRDNYSKPWQKSGKNSIWGRHENEMLIKTVIKGHCKLEPQCVEMERAVELDNRAEMGWTQLGMGRINELPMLPSVDTFDSQQNDEPLHEPAPPAPEITPGDLTKNTEIIEFSKKASLSVSDVVEFVELHAKKHNRTIGWIMDNARKSQSSFIRAIKERVLSRELASKEKQTPDIPDKGKEEPAGGSEDAAHMKEFWNLRKGAGGKTGLKAFVAQNIEKIYKVYSEDVRAKLIAKFQGFYPGEPFPKLATEEEAGGSRQPQPQDAIGGETGANDAPPFENPFNRDREAGPETPTKTEQIGDDILEAKRAETGFLASYDRAIESVLKFEQKDNPFTMNDLETFMTEMAHAEGMEMRTFKIDVMRNFQFPNYFENFKKRLKG